MSELTPLSTDHVTTLASNDMGFYARCSCGWIGSTRDRMSDDYAWSNARDDMKSHERMHKTEGRS